MAESATPAMSSVTTACWRRLDIMCVPIAARARLLVRPPPGRGSLASSEDLHARGEENRRSRPARQYSCAQTCEEPTGRIMSRVNSPDGSPTVGARREDKNSLRGD
jgi:hypothetical protein